MKSSRKDIKRLVSAFICFCFFSFLNSLSFSCPLIALPSKEPTNRNLKPGTRAPSKNLNLLLARVLHSPILSLFKFDSIPQRFFPSLDPHSLVPSNPRRQSHTPHPKRVVLLQEFNSIEGTFNNNTALFQLLYSLVM